MTQGGQCPFISATCVGISSRGQQSSIFSIRFAEKKDWSKLTRPSDGQACQTCWCNRAGSCALETLVRAHSMAFSRSVRWTITSICASGARMMVLWVRFQSPFHFRTNGTMCQVCALAISWSKMNTHSTSRSRLLKAATGPSDLMHGAIPICHERCG